MLLKLLLVFLGAGVGGVCRWGVHSGCERWLGKDFPVGTLTVNTIGCLLVGIAAAVLAGGDSAREPWRLGLVVGFLGGFTTFSAFGVDTVFLLRRGQTAVAMAYVVASVVCGIAALWLLMKAVPHRPL